MSEKQLKFEEAMEEDDFGLIIGKNGDLKGLFVPQEYEEVDYVPEAIVQILSQVYGIELDGEVTLH
jgi:hypothetical protein